MRGLTVIAALILAGSFIYPSWLVESLLQNLRGDVDAGEAPEFVVEEGHEVHRGLAARDAVMVVILPDGGRSYLSKLYNDAWMRDNGLLELEDVRVQDVLNAKKTAIPELVTVDAADTVRPSAALHPPPQASPPPSRPRITTT